MILVQNSRVTVPLILGQMAKPYRAWTMHAGDWKLGMRARVRLKARLMVRVGLRVGVRIGLRSRLRFRLGLGLDLG